MHRTSLLNIGMYLILLVLLVRTDYLTLNILSVCDYFSMLTIDDLFDQLGFASNLNNVEPKLDYRHIRFVLKDTHKIVYVTFGGQEVLGYVILPK